MKTIQCTYNWYFTGLFGLVNDIKVGSKTPYNNAPAKVPSSVYTVKKYHKSQLCLDGSFKKANLSHVTWVHILCESIIPKIKFRVTTFHISEKHS